MARLSHGKSMQSVAGFLRQLTPDSRILVSGHVRPDGDAVGATLALVRSLNLAGLDATPLLVDNKPAPEFYSWLAGFDAYQTPADIAADQTIDLYIVVDTPVTKRLSGAEPLLERAKQVVVIDHHPPLEEFGDLRLIDPNAAAASQMVWEVIAAAQLPVDADIATACYCGVASDTGRFMFSNTDASVFRAVAQMAEEQADIHRSNVQLFSSKSAEVLELESLVLERMMVLNGGKVTASWLTADDYERTGARRDEAESIIDLIRTLKGGEVALLVTFTDASTRVSLRSKTDFDVGRIAAKFGGGGHQPAAGVNWPDVDASLSEILDTILPLLPGA